MENSTIILITWSVIISLLYVGMLIKNNRLFKDINHQKALNAVLRFRLKDRQQPTLEELKEINVWSGKAVNKILNKKRQLRHFANTGVMSPIVDNTGEPPRGSDPINAHKAKECCNHDFKPTNHPATFEFDRCTKCGEIN